jgi:hypothetical protein
VGVNLAARIERLEAANRAKAGSALTVLRARYEECDADCAPGMSHPAGRSAGSSSSSPPSRGLMPEALRTRLDRLEQARAAARNSGLPYVVRLSFDDAPSPPLPPGARRIVLSFGDDPARLNART